VANARRTLRELTVSDVLVPLGVAVLYVAAARLGLALALQAPQVSAVWPPTGLALAALLRFGKRAVPGVFLGALFANAMAEEPLWVAMGIAVGNTLEAVLGTALLRRSEFEDGLARARDALALLGAAVVAPVVSATIGVTSLVAGHVQPASSVASLWRVWWLGDALGAVIVAPLLLLWTRRDPLPARRGAAAEFAAGLALLVAATGFAFVHASRMLSPEYLVFPFLIWGGLRFGPSATAAATAATYAVAVWATHRGLGPFAGTGPEGGLVPLQIFMAVAAMTGLVFGAIAAQTRQAREAALESRRRLVLALNAARMGAWDWNIGTGEVRWSGELEPLHGLPRGGFAGTYEAFQSLIHPDDRDRIESAVRRSLETRAPYEEEFRLVGADGVERWTDARGQVIQDHAGNPIRMVGVGIDVTRKKRMEEELRRQAEQMREEDRRKNEFLAILSHELRNPLAPILHAVDLLANDDPRLAAKAREIIGRQSTHLTRLVDDLLDVSRITRGTIRLDRRPVAVRDAVEAAADTWRHLLAQRSQELSVDVPDEPLFVDADPTRLAQVVANLLHNAAKFTPEGGRIAITARRENGQVVVTVRDNGPGIPVGDRERIFEIFAQGARSHDRPTGGLGLGLTLARRLAELHGGTLEAANGGPQGGSEFVVRLPVAVIPPPAPAARVAAPPPETSRAEPPDAAARKRRILVVDDNADARAAMELLLLDEGHEVRGAGDGPEALKEARRFRPEIVFLDIGLPGMDGYDVARALRAEPACAGALIVAVSGYGQAEDRARSRVAGFDQHLLKPVTPERLLEVVRRAGA